MDTERDLRYSLNGQSDGMKEKYMLNQHGECNDVQTDGNLNVTDTECQTYASEESIEEQCKHDDQAIKVFRCKSSRNISCDSCSDEFNSDEYRFCENCTKNLCKSCYEMYKHNAKETLKLNTAPQKNEQNKCLVSCKSHPGKQVDCVCEMCDHLGCSVCMVKEHRDCPNDTVKYIPNIAGNYQDSSEYKSFLMQLNRLATDLETDKKKIVANRRRSDVLHETATEEINRQRANINQLFDKLQKDIESQLRTRHEHNQERLENVSEAHKSITHDLTTLRSKLEQDQRQGNTCQLFLDVKAGKEELKQLQADICNVRKENEIPYYETEVSPALQSALQDVKELGKLVTPQKDVQTASDIPVSSRKDLLPFCCVTGICSISENKLIIADYKNYKLKVIDTSKNKHLSDLTLPGPWAISKVRENMFAVTLPSMRAVQFLSMSSSFSLCPSYQLFLHGPCRSIACTKTKMIISYFDASVHILDLSGNHLADLTVDVDGNRRFEKPWNVALSPNETVIYVSDMGRHTVSSMTFDGAVIAVFKDDDMGGPRGLAVDTKGDIFVCCYLSNNILQLTKDLKKVCDLLVKTDGVCNGRCLAYCSKNSKLFIGRWETDVLKVCYVK